MQPQRPAEPPDRDEQVDQLGPLRQQLGELVDHHDESGQRRQVGTGPARGRVLGDADQVARGAQRLLAAGDLAGQRVGHAVDERELVGEVGDHRGDVREAGEAEERGAALEVDEYEVELRRGVGGREPQHEGAQQLALARTGGADAQPVRTAATLGGFLEVEGDRATALVEPDGHP